MPITRSASMKVLSLLATVLYLVLAPATLAQISSNSTVSQEDTNGQLAHAAAATGDPVVVIVNGANPVDNLSVGKLKRLFLSDRSRWDTGKSVAPVMPSAGAPERTAFLKIVCGMNDADFSKYFVAAAFTSKDVTPPKEVSSSKDVKSVVAGSAGTIGFVKAGDFHGDGSDSGVKAVKVDGSTGSDAGYKIRI